MMKKIRQAKMMEIIQKYNVETQEELAEKLRDAGFRVTQATVSRDIRELNLSKMPTGDGGQKYAVMKQEEGHLGDRYIRVLHDAFSSMAEAQNLLVIKTASGMAMAAAAALDALNFVEIVGCIAGDDTIFVATGTVDEAKTLADKIRTLIL